MPYPGINAFKRARGQTGPIPIAVDTAFTPPATTSNPSPKAGEVWAGELVALSPNGLAMSLSNQALPIATTSATAVTAVGSATVTPSSMEGIYVGSILVADTGTQQETVAVTAITATTLTATFTKTHASGFAIRDRQISLISTTSLTAATSTAVTVGTLAAGFTVDEWVMVLGGSGAAYNAVEIAQVTAKTGTTITIETVNAHTQPFQIVTLPVNTVGNTNVGSVTITPAAMTNINVGTQLLVDTVASGVQETVTVTATGASTFAANFLNAHSTGFVIAAAPNGAQAANLIGVSADNSFIEVLPAPGGGRGAEEPNTNGPNLAQYIQIVESGDFAFLTTAGDTYHAYDPVYVSATSQDGRTVQKTANGPAIGRVSPDQRDVGVALGSNVSGATGQSVIVRIHTALL